LIARDRFQIGDLSMAKERKTADQLSDMIVSAMGIGEVYVNVRKDHPRQAYRTSSRLGRMALPNG
jgi:hypothetical protein